MPLTRSRRWRLECSAEGAESRARIAAAGEERGRSGPEASAAAVALTITSPRELSRRPDRRHSHQQLTTTIATTAAATAASAVAAALTATAITSTAHAASASSATSFPAADLAAATSAALAAASRR
jgi:hypothetical protein